MWNGINRLTMAAYIRTLLFMQNVNQDLRNLKDDERGLSGIVVAVLLILIAVLAAVMLWGSLSGWLGDMWSKVTGAGSQIQGGSTF